MAENNEFQNLELDQLDQAQFPTTFQTSTPPIKSEEDAMKALDSAFINATNSIPGGNSGKYNPKLVPENSVKKFLDMPYGYRHGLDNETFYGDQESALKTAGKFFGRFALGTVNKVGQGTGFLLGLANPINWDADVISKAADNGISEIFNNLD
jgi:hypothetical protein